MTELNNIIAGYLALLKSSAVIRPENAATFTPGQKLLAEVIGKEGESYILQSKNQRFTGLSETKLSIGQELELMVASNKEGVIWLKIIPPEAKTKEILQGKLQNEISETRNKARRYGVFNDKEIMELSNLRQSIPGDENRAVRYLLDPHLLTAILLPEVLPDKNKGSIEVNRYKNTLSKQDVWEISLELAVQSLGLVEAKIRLVEDQFFIQIWAEKMETENLIRENQNDLTGANYKIEIVPANMGPLIYREKENIDYRV